MNTSALIKKMLEARESWLEVEPGKRIKVRRPAECEVAAFAGLVSSRVAIDAAVSVVVGWDGITEADLLGASIGADEPVAFSEDVSRLILVDRQGWVGDVVLHAVRLIEQHNARKASDEKN